MLRRVLGDGSLTGFATIGLIVFVLVFVGVCAWILTRSKREVGDWARIPLSGDDDDPIDDRTQGQN